MSQALLISDNEIVNSMYEVNLRAYVATNVTIKESLTKAQELLELTANFDAIICFKELLKNEEELKGFLHFLNEKSIDLPLIVLGDLKEELPNSIMVKNKYNIKMLLQSMAKILDVTARDMASLKVGRYFPVPLHLVEKLERTPCAVFKRSKKDNLEYDYQQVLDRNLPLGSVCDDLRQAGESHLYIDSNERLRFINLASKLVIEELDRNDLTASERIEIAEQGMEIVADDIFANGEITAEVAEISKKCIESISKVVKKVPGVKDLLKLLVENQTDYCYRHSVISSYISSLIIDKMSWGTPEQSEKVSFALFFHDLYLVPIYKKYPDAETEEDLLFMEAVSDEDKQIVLDHAKMSGQMIKTFPRCPMGADLILTQHHGMTNGQGFAVNFKDDISPLAKIILISEEITAEIMKMLRENKKISIDKTVMAAKLADKFRNHTYKKIILAFKETKL